ncbi:MAG: 30S ribosomal protein S12 methylthiotransferase RimO [Leptospiraceae bacterium]|nr:30S ribosomal protein S12 methylthiotransferase RimO [Leptospiraceae bacterium]
MKEKQFYITTLGCPKNIADSEHMKESLLKEGLVISNTPETADLHLINTCTFIQSATEETIETILDAGKVKKKHKQKLVVVGCFAERYPDAIARDIPEVDLSFGTGKYSEAGSILKKNFPELFGKENDFNSEILSRSIIKSKLKKNSKPYAYVKVSDGCNRGCHFCIIPSLRGEFRDAPKETILKDAKLRIEEGAKEICIVSQDTVFYGKDTDKLKSILNEISELEGLEILRLLYLYPDKKTFKLLDLVLQNEKIAPYFESPVQHVSEKILKSMNRIGNANFYKELFAKARERKGLEIRTSMILGYPGETSNDVDEVIQFVKDVKPEKLALFAYSPQEGTEGFKIKSEISEKEAAHRVNLVREVHLEVLKEIHQDRVGKEFPAIIDSIETKNTIVRRYQDAPEIDEVVFVPKDSQHKIGQIGKVKIESFLEYDMLGEFRV